MEQFKLEHSPIVYYVSGREHREWVLFLHAAFADHNMFRAQTEYFRDSYNVLTVDVIGHGQSTDTAKGDGIDKMSVWIYDILKVEKIEKIHIVGVSLGAVLAQDFANRYPGAVKSLACFGGYDINHFDRKMQNVRFPKKSFLYLASLNSMVNKYQTVKREYPLLIGCGKFDIPMELTAVEQWKRNEPDCKVIVFENAGHCVNMDVPQEFHAALEELWS